MRVLLARPRACGNSRPLLHVAIAGGRRRCRLHSFSSRQLLRLVHDGSKTNGEGDRRDERGRKAAK